MVKLEICRLCFDDSEENSIDLYQQNTKDLTKIGKILKQHFWFDFGINETELLSEIICQKCWSYVERFDDFFNLIKVKHQQYYGQSFHISIVNDVFEISYNVKKHEIKDELSTLVVEADDALIKDEPSENNDLLESKIIAIPLDVLHSDGFGENDEHCSNTSDSEEEYKPPTKKKKITRKSTKIKRKPAAIKEEVANDAELIRKYFKMECDQCSELFKTFSHATSHYRTVHRLEQGHLYCCDTKFNRLSLIRQHYQWHENPELIGLNGEENREKKSLKPRKADSPQNIDQIRCLFKMQCDICSEKFQTFSDVKTHFQKVHNLRNGYLVCCSKKFYRISRALEHCEWHANPNLFKCELCNKTFMENCQLFAHITNIHTPDEQKLFKCDACPTAFAKEHMLRKHKRTVHAVPDGQIYECHLCGKKYGLKLTLRFHIENVHQNRHSHMCDVCAKSFKSKKYYQMHYLSEHTNIDQKVQCELCGKWLKHQESLQNHMRFHAAPPAQCKTCGRITPNKKALREHVRRTHTEPTLKCTVCEKMFKTPQALREHTAIHTGNKDLYTCTYCPTTFRSSSNMYKHRKEKHPKEYEENKAKGLK